MACLIYDFCRHADIQAPSNQSPVTTQGPTGPTSPTDMTPTTIHPTLNPPTQPAPAHNGWTMWSSWTPCSMACARKRYRFCLNNDVDYCPGHDQQIERCPPPCKSKNISNAATLALPVLKHVLELSSPLEFSEIGNLLLPSRDMAERSLNRR